MLESCMGYHMVVVWFSCGYGMVWLRGYMSFQRFHSPAPCFATQALEPTLGTLPAKTGATSPRIIRDGPEVGSLNPKP